jgi:Spy/CpxP family protein refolding chaperone
MLKKHLAVLAAGIICIAAPIAVAQDSPASNPPSDKGSWHHGPPDPAQRTQELTRKLNLTSDQQTKVQEILQSERSQMESLRQDQSQSADRRTKMMDIHKSSDAQVRALLDANQKKKWDEMQARRSRWMEDHRPGPPDADDKAGPPPQL